MILNKTHLIVFLVGAVLGLLSGFFIGKGVYDKPIEASVKTDTITVHDTIPDYSPHAKDSVHIKYVTKWLQKAVHDTIDNYVDVHTIQHDTVAVEVPITQKHYNAPEYDAYVSGFEPNLDSIFVYQKTEYITKTITLSKPPNRFTVGIQAGYGYGFKSKEWQPYVGVGLGIRVF